jgi:hypothetical protein
MAKGQPALPSESNTHRTLASTFTRTQVGRAGAAVAVTVLLAACGREDRRPRRVSGWRIRRIRNFCTRPTVHFGLVAGEPAHAALALLLAAVKQGHGHLDQARRYTLRRDTKRSPSSRSACGTRPRRRWPPWRTRPTRLTLRARAPSSGPGLRIASRFRSLSRMRSRSRKRRSTRARPGRPRSTRTGRRAGGTRIACGFGRSTAKRCLRSSQISAVLRREARPPPQLVGRLQGLDKRRRLGLCAPPRSVLFHQHAPPPLPRPRFVPHMSSCVLIRSYMRMLRLARARMS